MSKIKKKRENESFEIKGTSRIYTSFRLFVEKCVCYNFPNSLSLSLAVLIPDTLLITMIDASLIILWLDKGRHFLVRFFCRAVGSRQTLYLWMP